MNIAFIKLSKIMGACLSINFLLRVEVERPLAMNSAHIIDYWGMLAHA